MLIPPGQNGFDTLMTREKLRYRNFWFLNAILILITVSLTACAQETLTPTPTPSSTMVALESLTPSPAPSLRPTYTPTLPPLGSEGNPISIGFVLTPEEEAAQEAAEDIAFMIASDTGYALESLIYPDFQSLSSAIFDNEIDLFWLGPFEYIYLNWEESAQVVLIANHLGVYAYGVQFMAHTERGFTSYYNPETNQNEGNITTALQQFAGTRPCLINSNSIPGYYVPIGLLAKTSTPTLDPIFTYDYSAIVRALYVQGICDFGVGYALIGDPRTAGGILQDMPDAQEQVEIIWQTAGIIPNINLSASIHLPLHIRYRLQEAFLDLAGSQEGLSLISTALDYDVEALKVFTDQFYNPLRDTIIPLEPDLQAITQSSNP